MTAPAAGAAPRNPAMADPLPAPAAAPAAPDPRRARRRRLLLIGIPLVVVAIALTAWLLGGRTVSTDDAYVKANVLTVSTDVAGTVAEVAVRENERVAAGQLLYRLDDEPYRLQLAAAEARLAVVRDDVAVLRATYAQKQAEARQAQADAAFFRKEYARVAPLVAGGAATPAQVDAAQRSQTGAEERQRALEQQAAAALADLGGDEAAPAEAHPRVRQAAAERDLARRNLARTRVSAPAPGTVSHVDALRPGLALAAAAPALALVESGELWVEASPKESDLTWVRPGQAATVAVDAYPGRAFPGTVDTISPATGAQFALLPAQNASGNWVKVVQRIPLRIALRPDPGAPELRAGMSVTVVIDTGHRRSLGDLLRGLGAWFGLGG
jgi:membrane fusion protein (multidrug efflux system)